MRRDANTSGVKAHTGALDAFRGFCGFFAEPVLLLTASGTIVAANEAAARIGLAPGPSILELAIDREGVREYLTACLRVGSPAPGRISLNGGGRERRWRTQGSRWQLGDPDAYVILRLLAADSAANQFAALTQRIEALNQEIHRRRSAEERLRKRENELREADRRKDQFLATLAHELRNPLAPIRSATEVLNVDGAPREAQRNARDIIRRQVDHMVRLVDDLLDASRIATGKLVLRPQRLVLQEVVPQAVESARPYLLGHEFTLSLPSEPIYIDGDEVRLAQVFSNLLTNAAKYTEKGGHIRLTVESDGRVVVLRVKDTGIGIAADQLPLVFDMFWQVKPTLERSQEGLGIGLSLARALVEMHGGSIEADSPGVGHGSEFIVRLPVAAEQPAAPVGSDAADWSRRLTARRILIVDDNRDAADSLATLLRFDAHDVYTAYDGLDGIRKAESLKPDVILLDIGMPNMNGYETCRHMRAMAWGRDAVIVAMTGWGQEEDRAQATQAGFDAHLTKPVEHAQLTKVLASLLLQRVGG